MSDVRRGLTLLAVLLAMMAGWSGHVAAQTSSIPTTTVQDTIYSANGTPASGTVLLSWNAFTTANGASVPAGSTSAMIGAGGVLTIALAPNAGATPMGSYYTAILHLSDGTTSRQYWVVPVAVPGGGPAKLAAIQNQVLPTSVAMQTVSKQYVDNAIAAAVTGFPTASSPYVLKAGDTMTGPLVLPADPVSPNQAADKNYVDNNVAAIAGGLGQKVSLLPSATQVVAQPGGTQLQVNDLNGDLYASQYVSGAGNNGIANAVGSANCTSGCTVNVEPTYNSYEQANSSSMPSATNVVDQRGGTTVVTAVNPLAPEATANTGASITEVETLSGPQLQALRPGAVGISTEALSLTTRGQAGGSNQFPQGIEQPPYFKSTYGVLQMQGIYNTQGQHVQTTNDVYCYAVGDCLAGGQYIYSSGGYRDEGDEGAHPFDLNISEDQRVFEGTCASGCTIGSTNLGVTATASPGTQGDGRFLIDTNPAKVISTGTLVSGIKTLFGVAGFSGTTFPASVFLSTSQAATSQSNNLAPGTVTLSIATSGVPSGFDTNTAALPATTGVACVADVSDTPNFETASYTVIDGSHLQLALNKVHASGAAIAVGGLCGYGLEQKVDTTNGIRQVFPVIGSINATQLYYSDAAMPIIAYRGAGSTSGYLNLSLAVASITRTANVVTVTTAGNLPYDVNGLTLTVSGVADSSYNGSYVVSTTGANTLTYTSSGANSTSSGGTLTFLTGNYALYPMAEVLSVFDTATKQVNGSFTLAANTVPWAAGDTIEEPHYYKQLTSADVEQITQYVPRPIQYASAGKTYEGLVGAGLRGWAVTNLTPLTSYLGGGGTYTTPDDAYQVSGAWSNDFEVDAGVNAIIRAHCNLNTCGRWDSTYKLFDLDGALSEDALVYYPQSSTAQWQLHGTSYTFSPTGFSAGTINVGTLNATTLNGAVNASAISSGTVSAARLPLFGPSGSAHAAGIVPDPGATAGSSRYLREDGSWAVPAGGSGGSGSGTMASQNASSVAISGGAIDGTVIGGTTPAGGSFTTLTPKTIVGPSGIIFSSTAPTIASGFGSTPSIISSNGTAAVTIHVSGTPGSGVLTYPAATTGWTCTANQVTVNSTSFLTTAFATSSTTVALQAYSSSGSTSTWANNDFITVQCVGR